MGIAGIELDNIFTRVKMSRTKLSFETSGEFLRWWFEETVLDGKALEVFERYYRNYLEGFEGYLSRVWTDRHKELDEEIRALQDKQNVKIIDLGCGTGSVSLYVAGKLEGKGEVLGIDINTDRLVCAKARLRVLENQIGSKLNCSFREEDVLSLNGNEEFDLVYAEETLHHLEPRREMIRKISKLIKNDGVLIISEVNAYNPLMQSYVVKKRGFRSIKSRVGKDGQTRLYGVERIMTPKRVAKLFEHNGLHAKSLRYFRVASSSLGKLAHRNGLNVLGLEKALCKIPIIRNLLAIHYNIAFVRN